MNIKALITAASVLALPFAANAQVITTSLANGAGQTYDLSASQAWGSYSNATNPSNTTPVTGSYNTDTNLGSFSALSANGASGPVSDGVSLSYSTGTVSQTGNQNGYVGFNFGSAPGASLSFDSTLFASDESFHLYLSSFQSTAGVDVLVTDALGITTLQTYTNVFSLPVTGSAAFNQSADGEHGYGDLTVNLSGFAAGDIVTFSLNQQGDAAAVNGNGFSDFGIEGVTAAAATPEPSTWMLLGMGVGALFVVSRVRRLTA